MKILSFTSNSYRGRLYASYILSMPTVIRWGWEAIVSKFVSENTLKKLKITGEDHHDDMWAHINRKTVEKRYGGDLPNIDSGFWPPRQELLLFTDPRDEKLNHLISASDYDNYWRENKLLARKIYKHLIKEEEIVVQDMATVPVRAESAHEWLKDMTIRTETPFGIDQRTFTTFFQSDSFSRICAL
jgi:hypothetical protein